MDWLNVSYNDPSVERALRLASGEPIGLWEAIRCGGRGTARLILTEASGTWMEPFDRAEDRRTCSLELRRGGMVLRCRSRLETMALPLRAEHIVEITLGAPASDGMGMLRMVHLAGHVVLLVPREHWGAVARLLRHAIPDPRFRSTPTLH
jgi:hypothetical protein